MKTYGVILAGGGGTRFWPLSRKELPKQLLNLTGKDLMVNETIDRLEGNVEKENILVVTNSTQAELMLTATAGRVRPDHVLAEPAARNTAACIGYAAMEILCKYGDGVMCVLPSDHYIKNVDVYKRVIASAIDVAGKTDALVTIGIQPAFPSTGYGYICHEEKRNDDGSYAVRHFVEKPNLQKAKEYLLSGEYLWNSGMFIWKVSSILHNMKEFLPDMYDGLCKIGEAVGTDRQELTLEKVFPQLESVSIDYGIMEKAKDIYILPGVFGWDDVGSWLAVERIQKSNESGNVVKGNIITIHSKNNIIQGGQKLIAAVGLENMVIVDTDDATLICDKDSTADIKMVLENLKICNREEYL